ncbi:MULTISPECIES: dihydroxyacetone kinase phosphoryl donor subunit DhaM [unclassified Isoptericola]|uniref:dihydroxyacetone kinase phosphoryl donor subunit DhaM n=1 Tax=unclassified Isoptericola TaxID=2623355 RepID=UPI003666061C
MSVGLLLVSHSARLAEGAAELAREMAPDVALACGAGDGEGGLGTSLEVVQEALGRVLPGVDGVVVLADLGSAVLTVETALELDDDLGGRVLLADAPFVEGAVAAAVAAQQGGDLAAVLAAARSAGAPAPTTPAVSAAPAERAEEAPGDVVAARVTIRNPLGLHARPAAVVARAAAAFGGPVTLQGVDATSVLQLMALGTAAGTEVEVAAHGPDARDAVATVVGLIEGGFGEV